MVHGNILMTLMNLYLLLRLISSLCKMLLNWLMILNSRMKLEKI